MLKTTLQLCSRRKSSCGGCRPFKKWQLWIAIQSVAGTEEVWDNGRSIGYDKYSVDVWERETDPIHVELRNGKVQIKTRRGLSSVAAYLDTISFAKGISWSVTLDISDGHKQSMWDRQWDWWRVRSNIPSRWRGEARYGLQFATARRAASTALGERSDTRGAETSVTLLVRPWPFVLDFGDTNLLSTQISFRPFYRGTEAKMRNSI
ncbi:hypothetical protein AC579_6089 [Pseudocercospora musae]|uniref:Uncharacterized protein n=1 Tax=Pseudocercospora musae TaxID=113226 RepID=A0A139IAR5_9PEZI|nr:hypothetical protein AC579_6089 [Pseudocercospora musae]